MSRKPEAMNERQTSILVILADILTSATEYDGKRFVPVHLDGNRTGETGLTSAVSPTKRRNGRPNRNQADE